MEIRRIATEDGSDSLYVPGLDETYHSIHGAIQESKHVFIKNGLEFYLEKHQPKILKILEFGFGTGLNTLLTLANQGSCSIAYTSLEKHPVARQIAGQLNYGDVLGQQAVFNKLHDASWALWEVITKDFRLLKLEIDFLDFQPQDSYDIIYFDAFAPSKQPELWSLEIMQKCYQALKRQGIFVTYSAKGQVRRYLEKSGFMVERLPGPPGKFEMLRATKC